MSALRPLQLPARERRVLSNQLTVHLIPRGQLPLVAVRLVIRRGSAFDTPGRLGVADFAARLLRRGAAGKTGDQLSEAVEFGGASLSGFSNEESTIVSLSTPAKHLPSMLEVLAEVVMQPDFPEHEVELARRRTIASIANELDDPGALADKALIRALWGEHPLGHDPIGCTRDLETIARGDLVEFQRSLSPKLSNLYVVGDVDSKQVIRVVERTLGRWSSTSPELPALPPWKGPVQAGRVVIVDKPDQTQVQLRIGAKGVARRHPDYFPITVMSAILGGGFTSRLVTEVRVKRGLSYGAGCGFDMMAEAGTFSVSSFTKTENTAQLVEVALSTVEAMRARGATARELATSQRLIAGLYPGRLETNEGVAGAWADVEHYGLPEDSIATYRERVMEVSRGAVLSAARAHLFGPGDRVIVLVGNAAALRPGVSRYGPPVVLKPADLA